MADLITVAEYEDYDGLPSPVDAQTKLDLAACITNATAYIEAHTGKRTFQLIPPSPIEITEIVSGVDSSRIYMQNGPVTSVSKLEYWTGTDWQEVEYIQQPFTYKPDSHIVYFREGSKFFKGYENWRITYGYGYDTTYPQDLKYACYVITKHMYNETNRQGIATQQDGEQNWNYTHKIPLQATEIIRRYKHYV